MTGWRGLLSGALSLVALQVVVATEASASRTGAGLSVLAGVARRAISPAVPLVPDLRGTERAKARAQSSRPGSSSAAPASYDVPSTRPATPRAPASSNNVNRYVST